MLIFYVVFQQNFKPNIIKARQLFQVTFQIVALGWIFVPVYISAGVSINMFLLVLCPRYDL